MGLGDRKRVELGHGIWGKTPPPPYCSFNFSLNAAELMGDVFGFVSVVQIVWEHFANILVRANYLWAEFFRE